MRDLILVLRDLILVLDMLERTLDLKDLNITLSLCPSGDSSLSQSTSRPSREVPPQLLLPPQRPTTLPSSPRRPLSIVPQPQRPSPASPRSPQQETAAFSSTPQTAAPSAVTTPRKSSSSSSSTPSAPRSYMSPTASSMAKMSRSVSVGDGLNIPDPAEDPSLTSSLAAGATVTSASQVKETPPPLVAVVPSNAALATAPHAAVLPVVVASSLSLGNHGNPAAPPPRGLQARVPGSSRPLPDKPSLTSFSPSPSYSSSSSRPPPVSVSPLTPSRQEEEPQTPAGNSSVEQRDDAGLDSPLLLHPFILSSPHLGSGLWLHPSPSSSFSSLHSSSRTVLETGETFHSSFL